MKSLAFVLFVLVLAIQYPLWWGKGSWAQVKEYNALLLEKKHLVKELKSRNDGLDAEVRDLKQGLDAVEERARMELNMIEPNEHYWAYPIESAP